MDAERLLSDELIEVGRKAVEDAAIDLRDNRIAVICGNGIVCRERDGTASQIIRLRTDTAIRIALKAMLEHGD